ncbi:glycosyl transferase group 1 [Caldicellulosiruptor acetigenus I77R1B]|uniref:Glycosyl transferase group 1 n=2 Tax=Caldicellulosiruptor acetigenus TaxID=301953 RepID=G2PWB6_9FIRM|nr:glycosyltransferase [Caldicellulosiruptor acetigenus]ADQ41732.1 glycosyl transferase group 1 [Caldicellulosiruptor acetigenus I77R1B]AEM72860.1 glycosyl transferase group 1 [Caldicellulosiruptor acetigenus 6A]
MNKGKNKKATIVHVNVTTNGSTGRIMCMLHEAAKKEGFNSIIAYGRGSPPKNGEYIRIGNDFSVYSHVALTRLLDLHGLGSVRATKKFIKKLDELNPDLIHLHNVHGYYVNIKLLFEYLKEKKIPVVWTLHDCWAFTGHCAYFEYVGCDKWKTGCYDCPQVKKYPKSLFVDNSVQMYRIKRELFTGLDNLTIVCPSNWLANLVKQSFLSKYPVKVIHNGVDTTVFRPVDGGKMRERLNIPKEKFVILGVAANFKDERKGFKYFLELSKLIDKDCMIVLVGVSKKQIKNLPKNIIGLMRTENINELVEIYSMADVFVNLTLEDNFPTVNLESLACGTPVITFDSGGSGESIEESCGLLVKKGDLKSLFDSIMKVKSRKGYFIRCILYDKVNFSKEYVNVYNDLITCS